RRSHPRLRGPALRAADRLRPRAADEAAQQRSPRADDDGMSAILVTGAAGKIARVLRPTLREAYDSVRLADIKEVDGLTGGESFVGCDVRDLPAVEQAVDGVDAVIHLAASL